MSGLDQLSTPSLSSSSSTASSRPSSPSLSSSLLTPISPNPSEINPVKIKTLDLNSYFSDLDGEEDYGNTDEISKLKATITNSGISSSTSNSNSNYIQFDQIETLNEQNKEKFGVGFGLGGAASRSRSEEEEMEFDTSEEESEEASEDQEWVQTQWKALVERQKVREKEIRKLILSRKVLQPLDLKDWLDSDQTCDLPALSLGVLLRMDPVAASSSQITTIPKF